MIVDRIGYGIVNAVAGRKKYDRNLLSTLIPNNNLLLKNNFFRKDLDLKHFTPRPGLFLINILTLITVNNVLFFEKTNNLGELFSKSPGTLPNFF